MQVILWSLTTLFELVDHHVDGVRPQIVCFSSTRCAHERRQHLVVRGRQQPVHIVEPRLRHAITRVDREEINSPFAASP